MKYLSAFIFICLLSLFPLATHGQLDQRTEADIIRSNIEAMWSAVEKGDLEGYLRYIHEDYTLFGEGDIYLQSGKALERASYKDYLSRVKNVRTFMHQPDFHIRGDTAWVTYYWSDRGYRRADNTRFTSQGKSTRIFVKENDQWLCIHGHFTDIAG